MIFIQVLHIVFCREKASKYDNFPKRSFKSRQLASSNVVQDSDKKSYQLAPSVLGLPSHNEVRHSATHHRDTFPHKGSHLLEDFAFSRDRSFKGSPHQLDRFSREECAVHRERTKRKLSPGGCCERDAYHDKDRHRQERSTLSDRREHKDPADRRRWHCGEPNPRSSRDHSDAFLHADQRQREDGMRSHSYRNLDGLRAENIGIDSKDRNHQYLDDARKQSDVLGSNRKYRGEREASGGDFHGEEASQRDGDGEGDRNHPSFCIKRVVYRNDSGRQRSPDSRSRRYVSMPILTHRHSD